MRILLISELMRLTRIELCHLARRMARKLLTYPPGSPHHTVALTNLRKIRYVLAQQNHAPNFGS
jgi:hypothetical protein